MFKQFFYLVCITLPVMAFANGADSLISENWDDPGKWVLANDIGCSINLTSFSGENSNGLYAEFLLKESSGWVNMSKSTSFDPAKNPVTFLIKTNASSDLEMKFVDTDGSVFGKKISLENVYRDWQRITIYKYNTEYWWGGDNSLGELKSFDIALSGTESGNLWIDEIGIGREGLLPSFLPAGPVWDPDSALAGYGFRQRRHSEMIPEDSTVLTYLKIIQDISSPEKQLLPSMEGDEAQTFNNSLVAIAFILKNERDRAERILDFYSNATKEDNMDPTLQNFFYNGEARGFYQRVSLSTYHDESGTSDRWMGDMAWLLAAYKFYEKKYNSNRYEHIVLLLKDLLISFYIAEGDGGYIQHGWRNGDKKLHEGFGHHEGNIDCYAVLKLCGEDEFAQNIRTWLDANLTGSNYPLDLYTWRVLAYGKGYEYLLDIPEYDFRYRKILDINGEDVMGFYHGPDITVNNIWLDGTGHIACAYLLYGDPGRGNFYTNQLDKCLIERTINQQQTHSLPYTVNKSGGYAWVDTTKGFISCAAWYIMAKNGFNPLRLETITSVKEKASLIPPGFEFRNFPNPFNSTTRFKYTIDLPSFINVSIYDINGRLIRTLINREQFSGKYITSWDGRNMKGTDASSGIYYCRLNSGSAQKVTKVLLIR